MQRLLLEQMQLQAEMAMKQAAIQAKREQKTADALAKALENIEQKSESSGIEEQSPTVVAADPYVKQESASETEEVCLVSKSRTSKIHRERDEPREDALLPIPEAEIPPSTGAALGTIPEVPVPDAPMPQQSPARGDSELGTGGLLIQMAQEPWKHFILEGGLPCNTDRGTIGLPLRCYLCQDPRAIPTKEGDPGWKPKKNDTLPPTFDGLDGGTWHGPRIPTKEDNMEWKKKLGDIANTPTPAGISPQSEMPRYRHDRAWLDPARLQPKQPGYCAHALGEDPAGLRIAVLRDNVDLPWST